jgi:hypothetical protein
MTSKQTFFWGIVGVMVFGMIVFLYGFVNQSLRSSTGAYQVAPMMGGYEKTDSFGFAGEMMGAARDMAAPSIGMPGQMPAAPSDGMARKEIKTGSLSVVVDDVVTAVDQVNTLVGAQTGYVVASYISKDARFPSASVSVRVPAAKFDASMTELKKLGDVKSVQVQGQDVTEEYVDLEARLGNLRVTETQFAEIMKKASKIEDILAVQAQLSQVRGEIESLLGRKKYLDQNVEYSVISLNFSTSVDQLPVIDEDDEWKPLAILKAAVRDLLNLGRGVLNVVIWLVVFVPVWAILVGVIYYLKKKLIK